MYVGKRLPNHLKTVASGHQEIGATADLSKFKHLEYQSLAHDDVHTAMLCDMTSAGLNLRD